MDSISNQKFIVDKMYYRLGRWLRMLGYDTILNPKYVDQDYIVCAKKEKRILITRDNDLKQRAEKVGIKVVTIVAPTIERRLAKLSKEVGIILNFQENVLPRCTICNSEIEKIAKDEITDELYNGTKKNYNEFWICKNSSCKKVYWKGAHWIQMENMLKKSNKEFEKLT